MNRSLIIVVFILFSRITILGQELNAKVSVNSENIEGTYTQIFSSMQRDVTEFLNSQKWTANNFLNNEKIECSFLISIKSVPSSDKYSCELTVQARRPVYNSSYMTSIFNFIDKNVEFEYLENKPLIYNETSIDDNLVAVLAFYSYMIIGYDYESFSLKGGEPYFRLAESVVNKSQNLNEKGWKPYESPRNRFAIVNAVLDKAVSSFENLWYDYHRSGLDNMSQNPEKGRNRISSALETLKDIKSASPQSVLLDNFIDSKIDEIVNIYSKADSKEKETVYTLLQDIYPSYTDRLKTIRTAGN
ncbi:MAG: DUF4835 family protein [Bacteroidales bacterium]|nr:DUF4835 family protein [Bacteroidales bacterium]